MSKIIQIMEQTGGSNITAIYGLDNDGVVYRLASGQAGTVWIRVIGSPEED